jgi:hypothetical protein
MFSLLFVGNVFPLLGNISYKQQEKHFLQTTGKTFPTNNKENISYKQQGKHFLQTTRKTISYKQQRKHFLRL